MIKEISIRNFGIFKGLHKIVLSTDATTPVTVISTITASGKTTLIDAVCWCLYGKSSMKADAIFNCERQQELKTGEIDSVDVELIYSETQNFQRVYRSIAFKKVGDRIFRCPEYDSCSVENHNLFPVETIAQTLFLGELLHSPRFEAVIEEIGANYLRRHRIRNHEKLNALFNVIMERIAASASCAFKELNFRHGTYNIVWNGKFSMYRSDNNMLVNELSETDRLVFNIAILHGARDVLFERKKGAALFPIFIDDIFMRADKNQFSLDKLIQALPGRQVVVLAHENSLCDESISKYCGAFYTMRRTNNWTNVEIKRSVITAAVSV